MVLPSFSATVPTFRLLPPSASNQHKSHTNACSIMFQPSSAGVEAVAMDTRCVNGTVFGHTGNSAGAVGHKGMDHHGKSVNRAAD
jgi:hypothetical protein